MKCNYYYTPSNKKLVLLLLVMVLFSLTACTYQAASFIVTNPGSTLKVQPNTPNPGPVVDELRLAMAKGEYEPVQIVVSAVHGSLKNVRVSASHLRGPGRSIIPPGRVIVNPVGFVRCKISTPGATLKEEIPDVLLPNRTINIPARRQQPFFITIQSTSKDTAGLYRGVVQVQAEKVSPKQLRLLVRIYDVTLPIKSYLRTAFVLWGNFKKFLKDTDPDAYLDTYIRYAKTMLAYRISPITMWTPKKVDSRWDFSHINRYLSELTPLGLTTFNIGGDGFIARTRNIAYARAIAAHLKKSGWWHLHYLYGVDELPIRESKKVKVNYRALIKAVPDLKIMQTGWGPHPRLKGLVKIWCPITLMIAMAERKDLKNFKVGEELKLGGPPPPHGFSPPMSDLEDIRNAQAEGEEVWWFVCCHPNAPCANLFVDYPGIDHRILGWMTYRYGIQGFLYWGVDVWKDNSLPIEKYDQSNYANWNPNSFENFNGDGYLLYPGKDHLALASLRLALLRDGFEDYDLFTEVRSLAKGDSSLAKEARQLLNFKEPLIVNLTQYTQDGNLLLKRREAILEVAEKLTQKRRKTLSRDTDSK